jgi:formimidoylglutamase
LRRLGSYPPPKYHDPHDRRLVEIIRKAGRSRPNAVNILGVPFDGAVLGRRGAAGGPEAIRQAMSGFSNYNVELRVGLEKSRVFDLGDLALGTRNVSRAHFAIEVEVSRDLEKTSLLVILGGDNSISLPALKAFAAKFGKIGLVVVDSHFDLRGRIGGKPTSGSSYGLAIETLRGLDSRRVAEIGIHGFLNSSHYAGRAEKLGINVFTASDVRSRGPKTVAEKAYAGAAKGARAVYLSVDMDALDLAHVSGVSAPSAGGVSARELFELIFRLTKGDKVWCADLVELAPSLDPTGRSQVVAATALVYMIAGFSSRRR